MIRGNPESDEHGAAVEHAIEDTPFTRLRDFLVVKLGEQPLFLQHEIMSDNTETLYVRLAGLDNHLVYLSMRTRDDGGYELELEKACDAGEFESATKYVVSDMADRVTARNVMRLRDVNDEIGSKVVGREVPRESYELVPDDAERLLNLMVEMKPSPAFRKRCITTFG